MTPEYWNPELETLPWPKVLEWQGGQLERFIAGLPARSPFYREKWSALNAGELNVTSLDALRRLPFTEKSEVREAQSRVQPGLPLGTLQAAPLAEIVQTLSSSGTTGQPTYYGLTARDRDNWSDAIAQVWFTCGIRRDDVVAHLVGLPMVAGGLPYADGFRRLGATLAWLGGFPTERILAALPRLQVSALLATTSFGLHLAEQGTTPDGVPIRELGVRKYLSGGEPGLAQPEIRARIVAGFDTDHVRESMGLGDVLSGMWGECDAADGMHFNAQRYVTVELIEPESGEIVPWHDGAQGEAVYTTFDRDATPLVRYRSRDHLRVVGMGCACGRTSPRVQCIGRTDDMLIYKGMNVFPTAIREVVLGVLGTAGTPAMRLLKRDALQVRFDEPIPVQVEMAHALAPDEAKRLGRVAEDAVRARLQVRIRLEWVAAGTLPRTAYKTPLVQTAG